MRGPFDVFDARFLDEAAALLEEELKQVFVDDGKEPNSGTAWLSERAARRHERIMSVLLKVNCVREKFKHNEATLRKPPLSEPARCTGCAQLRDGTCTCYP